MGRKRKILYLITKSNWGGAQRYIYDLATHLEKDNFEVVVGHGGTGLLRSKLDSAGIRTINLPNLDRDIKVLDELKVFRTLIKLFRKEKPDIVHVNSSKIGGIGSLAARFTKVPKIIFTAHGFAFKEERGALFLIAIKIATWFTILLSHRTIVLSEREREYVFSWYLVGKKTIVIPNGISPMTFKDKEKARNELGIKIDKDTTLIGSVAELHKNKGLTYAIEALATIIDFPFIYMIIGEGKERNYLENFIKNKRCENKIFLTGYQEQVSDFLPAFDIFLLPSIKEGLPYTILEAGLASLPVIATRVGGIPEVIDNLQSGLLVEPRQPDEIKKALLYLNDHPEEAKRFGENLQRKVAENFSLKKMVRETERLYS